MAVLHLINLQWKQIWTSDPRNLPNVVTQSMTFWLASQHPHLAGVAFSWFIYGQDSFYFFLMKLVVPCDASPRWRPLVMPTWWHLDCPCPMGIGTLQKSPAWPLISWAPSARSRWDTCPMFLFAFASACTRVGAAHILLPSLCTSIWRICTWSFQSAHQSSISAEKSTDRIHCKKTHVYCYSFRDTYIQSIVWVMQMVYHEVAAVKELTAVSS